MDTLTISTGEKHIAINGDPERVIVFNPSDVAFAERFYDLIREFEAKLKEYQPRSEAIEIHQDVDENGVPLNLPDKLALMREVCEYMRSKIDGLFGAGTSQKVFGDALVLSGFEQFFRGITPYIQTARSEKIAQYTNVVTDKKRKHAVMK